MEQKQNRSLKERINSKFKLSEVELSALEKYNEQQRVITKKGMPRTKFQLALFILIILIFLIWQPNPINSSFESGASLAMIMLFLLNAGVLMLRLRITGFATGRGLERAAVINNIRDPEMKKRKKLLAFVVTIFFALLLVAIAVITNNSQLYF